MPRISLGNSEYATLDKLPNECPYCHKTVDPILVNNNKSKDSLEIIYKCPNLDCKRAFIGIYIHEYSEYYNLKEVNIGDIQEQKFSEQLTNISPNFVKIYNQAHFAEEHNLLEICGVGYRKALEFLIKDYLIKKSPANEQKLKNKFLGKCINEDVDDARVKKVSKRAVWLGNDETHYVRKWEGKNLQDLKKLIKLTIHWIEMEYLTEEIEIDMPE